MSAISYLLITRNFFIVIIIIIIIIIIIYSMCNTRCKLSVQ